MPDDNRNQDDDRQRKNGEFKMPYRNWIVWIAIICSVLLVVLLRDRMDTTSETLTGYQFQAMVDSNQIVKATIKFNPQSAYMTEITGTYKVPDKAEADGKK